VLWLSVSLPKFGLGNYALLFTNAAVQHIVETTARICVVTTLVTMVLAYRGPSQSQPCHRVPLEQVRLPYIAAVHVDALLPHMRHGVALRDVLHRCRGGEASA
jgi:hypothetical protein